MDKFRIKGGKVLRGTVAISGAKNSALPVMAAALLTAEKVTLHNIPKVRDLITMSKLLAFMDAKVSVTEMPASDYVIEALKLNHVEAPYELVKTMRASVLTLGPLMARVGMARVSLPGGCAREDGCGDFWPWNFDAADPRRGPAARYGTFRDSRSDRGGDVSSGGSDYRRGADDYALRARAFGSGDCEIRSGGCAD